LHAHKVLRKGSTILGGDRVFR